MAKRDKKAAKGQKTVVVFIVLIVVAALVLAGYYILMRNNKKGERSASLPRTEVGKLKAKDLELEYPGTPTEVVKLYWRLNKCLYNNSMGKKDFKELFQKQRMLYDDEFLEAEGNSYEEMEAAFKKDKAAFSKAKCLISSYIVDDDNQVKRGEVDGRECATLSVSILETVKSKSTKTYASFMCRKSEDGKWKILGWEQEKGSDSKEKE